MWIWVRWPNRPYISSPQKKIYWSEKFFKNQAVLVALVIRSRSCTLYGVVAASKWFGIPTSNGWIGAQRPLILSRTFYKKSAANRLCCLYLQLQLGQSGIKEINLVSKIIPCPFAILLALQKITSANSGAWTNTIPTDVVLFFADGYLL